jgi:carbonic anhydrase/acetyltransferase-like protein (isoleucine patch superfamily)
MAIVRSFRGVTPRIGEGTFVAETAVVVGDVEVGERSSLWYGVVLRGDVYHIRVGDECSIQDNAVIHVTSGRHPTLVGDRVTVGHAVTLHGCTVESECIIGMGAVILDRAVIGEHCVVGAGALVTPGTVIEPGHLVIGSPAKAKRKLSPEELDWIRSSAAHYVELAAAYLEG